MATIDEIASDYAGIIQDALGAPSVKTASVNEAQVRSHPLVRVLEKLTERLDNLRYTNNRQLVEEDRKDLLERIGSKLHLSDPSLVGAMLKESSNRNFHALALLVNQLLAQYGKKSMSTITDWIVAGATVVGTLVSIGAAIWSSVEARHSKSSKEAAEAASAKAKEAQVEMAKTAEQALQIQMGEAENSIATRIDAARDSYDEICSRFIEFIAENDGKVLSGPQQKIKTMLEGRSRAALEKYLNAYEAGCARYNDNKIDQVRFAKTYIKDIRRICEEKNPDFEALLHPPNTSDYKAMWSVYDEHSIKEVKKT